MALPLEPQKMGLRTGSGSHEGKETAPSWMLREPLVTSWAGPFWVVVYVLTLQGVVAAVAQTEPAEDVARAGTALSLPEPPLLRLAPIAGFDDDVSYRRTIAGRVAELVEAAEHADDAALRANLLLAAANEILAYQIEPACTRTILGIAQDAPGAVLNDPEVNAALDRADELLGRVKSTLQETPPAEPSAPEDPKLAERIRRASALQAFAQAQRAYLSRTDQPEAARHARRAASDLSVVLEDSDERVAAAAVLWQALLRGREADPTPALSALELALSDPSTKAKPFAFFSCLLRCRLLAARGGSAASLAILLQIEERCGEWFASEADRADARRTCVLLRTHILRGWFERLQPTTQADERQWCAARIQQLVEGYFAGGGSVLRLSPAIPILAPPPDADLPTPDSGSRRR